MVQPASAKKHVLCIDNRERLTASGVERIEFSSGELISARTADGEMHVKGEGLFIESLSAESGELLVKGKILAVSYAGGARTGSVWQRVFK